MHKLQFNALEAVSKGLSRVTCSDYLHITFFLAPSGCCCQTKLVLVPPMLLLLLLQFTLQQPVSHKSADLMSRFVQSQCWTFQVFSRSLIAQFDHNDICLVWPGLWKVHEVPDEKTLFENLSDNNAQFEHMNYKLESCCHSLSQEVTVLKKGGLNKKWTRCLPLYV